MKVLLLDIIAFLNANSRGLQAVDMLTLRTNMHGFYTQAKGIPQYIIILEEAQKKAKGASMPIANIKLVMTALAAVLMAQHFPCELTIGKASLQLGARERLGKHHSALPTSNANIRYWPQGGEPLRGAHCVVPADPPATLDWLETVLNNLVHAATNDTAVLQELTAANLALTNSVAALTATNKMS